MQALIVDDDEVSLDVLQNILDQLGCQSVRAGNGEEALAKLREGGIHLVITDWEMPRMNGIELCQAIRREEFEGYVYVIMQTGCDSAQQKIEGLYAGADAFLVKPVNPSELTVCMKTADRILSLETRDLAMFAMAKLAESRDPETGAHIERVQSYARLLAQYLSTTERYHDLVDPECVRLIYQTTPLHDIGKVGVPDNILLKPGKLTEGEFTVMKAHTTLGAQTLDASLKRFPNARFLQMAKDIAESHHEWWNGSGYPRGLSGNQIPLPARIVALADVYDAVTSRRVYRDAMSHQQAKNIILRERGTHFDPDIVAAFVAIEKQFIAIHERYRDPDGPTPAPYLVAQPEPAVPKVLVVDDDPVVCELLVNFLHANGLHALVAADGVEALAVVESEAPRIIIADSEMPRMDGLELCRRLRARGDARHIHFVMLTVHSHRGHLEKAFDVGVDDFLAKPFNEAALLARIRASLRAIVLHDELAKRSDGSQELNNRLLHVNEKLEALAITDDLTGLFNRRHAMFRLDEHWAMAERYGRSLSVLSLDIDHFKNINDTYGHDAGDAVLRGVAGILKECVRSTDVVCRVGGEEFLVLLPSQTMQEAEVCAHRCRQAIASKDFECGKSSIKITMSIGIGARRVGLANCADLLKDADDALYAAKEAGRNTVRVAREQSDSYGETERVA